MLNYPGSSNKSRRYNGRYVLGPHLNFAQGNVSGQGRLRVRIRQLSLKRQYDSNCTERRGQMVDTPASYSGGPGFKYRPGDQIYSVMFLVVSSVHPGEFREKAS
jgi:hypothetical protein